jgi:hypothetical protein
VVDIKTAQSASPGAFGRAVGDYGYDLQAAIYSDVYDCGVIFCVVESTPPHGCALYELEADVVERARQAYKCAAIVWQECVESGEWPGYRTEVTSITYRGWHRQLREEFLTRFDRSHHD